MNDGQHALGEIDLTDPDLYAHGDPHGAWRHLRRHAPVHLHPHPAGHGFWVITRYEDVAALSADRRLSNAGGTSTMRSEADVRSDLLVTSDPPRHGRLRALVNKAFTPRMVAGLEGYVRGLVRELLDAAGDRCEFVDAVASRIPFTVICELLGVPPEDRARIFEAIGHMMEAPSEPSSGRPPMLDLVSYFPELVEARRRDPRDDLVTALARVEGFSDGDILALCVLLFVAGSETTMNAMSGGMLAFAEHPEQWTRLRADPSLVGTAVEEVLRYTSPVLVSMVRTATAEVVVRGQAIAPGDKITLWYPSANRDPDAFADPDDFDIGRAPNDHLTFGLGPHFCLGAGLARLEIRVLLEEVLRDCERIELAGTPKRLRSNTFYGLERLPLAFARTKSPASRTP